MPRKTTPPQLPKSTPDVMGNVLDGTPAKQPDSATAQRHASIPARQHDSETVKVTLYLPGDVAEALDRAWAESRLAGEKTSKSAIAAAALRTHLGK